MPAVLPRLVLAIVFAVLPFLSLIAPALDSDQAFTLVIRMTSSTAGILQVFLDTGGGYTGDNMAVLPTYVSEDAHEYRIPLKVGGYASVRIDPGVGPGTFTVERVAVVDGIGRDVVTIPLADLTPAYHLRVVERTADKVVFECPVDAYDPQIIYAPPTPMWLLPDTRTPDVFARWFGLYVAVGFVLIWIAQLAVGRVAPGVSRAFEAIGRGASANPQVAVLIAALIATSVAMYPVLFAGRSLVSPNNGGVAMLFDRAPFTAASADLEIENVRGVDVGAMLWAFVPYSTVQRQAVASGEWPLWNRYAGPGQSLWGQGQSFFLDPLHWITLINPDPTAGWDLKFAAHRLVLACGVGVAALTLTGAWLPAAIAASTVPFAGIFAFRLNHPASFVMTYAPWVLVGWLLLARATTNGRRAAASVLLALASALVLFASPPKEAVVMLLVIELTGLLALILQVGVARRIVRPLGFALLAGTVTALLTMPHWLLFLDTLRASKTFYDTPGVVFAGPGYALSMILGSLAEGMPVPSLNTFSMALIVAALLSPTRLVRHRGALACLLGAAGAIAIASGVISGPWLATVPLIGNIIQINITFLTAALVPLFVLSGVGAAALLDGARARTIVMTLGAAAVAIWVFRGMGGLALLGLFRGWLVLGALGGAVLVPITMLALTRGFPRVLPVTAAVALGLLLMAPGGEHLETGILPLDSKLVQPRLRTPLSARSSSVDAIHERSTEPTRTVGLGNVLLSGSQALYGLEGLTGPDALFLRFNDELLEGSGKTNREGWRHRFTFGDLERDAPLLDMLNVGYLLAYFNEAAAAGPTVPVREPDVVLPVRRPTAWPRAYFVDRLSTYASPADLLAQARQAGRPIASIQDEDAHAAEITRGVGVGTGSNEVVRADRYTLMTNSTTFRVRAPHAGVAVLAESYMPDDFIATLNGQRVPYFRVNHALKGVAIPGAGDWYVRFEYRPHHWTLALGGAAVGCLMLVGLSVAAFADAMRRRVHSEDLAAV